MRRYAVLLTAVFLLACGGAQKAEPSSKLHEPPAEQEQQQAKVGPEVDPSDVASQAEPVKPVEVDSTGAEPEVTRVQVKDFMKQGPAFLLTRVEVEPVRKGNAFAGFKVVRASEGVAAFMAPQMVVGDVVTHINGIRVERPDDYLQAWNALAKTEWIRVDFTRGDDARHAIWAVKD